MKLEDWYSNTYLSLS